MKKKIVKKTIKDKPDKTNGEIPPKTYYKDELDGITLEHIESIINDLNNTKIDTGRKFKLLTGCRTNGFTDLELGNLCDHPECGSCRGFEQALKDAANNWNIDGQEEES